MDKKLESRILRLERLLNKKSVKKSVKNEDAGGSVYDAAYQWAQDYLDDIEDDYWTQEAGGVREALQIIADQAADPIVDSCCDDLESDYNFELSDSDRDVVASALAAAAEEAMQYMRDEDDEEFESCKRTNKYVSRKSTLEQRIDKLERLFRI